LEDLFASAEVGAVSLQTFRSWRRPAAAATSTRWMKPASLTSYVPTWREQNCPNWSRRCHPARSAWKPAPARLVVSARARFNADYAGPARMIGAPHPSAPRANCLQNQWRRSHPMC